MGGVFPHYEEAPPMSVAALKTLLREARSELGNFIGQADRFKSLSDRATASLRHSQQRVAEKIDELLTRAIGPLKWRSPESGTWHAKHGGYEISVFKEAGSYYWQISCSDSSAPRSFDDAEEVVSRLVGLE